MSMIEDLAAKAIREEAEAGLGAVIDLRRAIHREPELGIANPVTIGRVGAALPIVQSTSFAFLPVMLPLVVGKGVDGLAAL